jgi:four helix bundle protein
VGANYRASSRAKSKADFIYKIQIVLEESDETLYWLEIIQNTQLSKDKSLPMLIKEANELTSIFAATTKTAKSNLTSSNLRS